MPPGTKKFAIAKINIYNNNAINEFVTLFIDAETAWGSPLDVEYWIPAQIIDPTTTTPTPKLRNLTTAKTISMIGLTESTPGQSLPLQPIEMLKTTADSPRPHCLPSVPVEVLVSPPGLIGLQISDEPPLVQFRFADPGLVSVPPLVPPSLCVG